MSELRQVYTTVDARDRIVEAALTVFAKLGFDGATTREIAKEAGVSPGLIHHHFQDKETLWKLVGTRITEEFAELGSAAVDPALQGKPEGLKQMLAAYMRYWREHPRALRFQLWRVLGAPKEERKSRSQSLNQLFVPHFKAAQDAGLIRQDVPAGLLMVTAGGLVQFFLHSDIETNDALAVTGAPPLEDDAALDYLWGLIAADRPASKPARKPPSRKRSSSRT
ncbi:HTH-type transcriptional repressor Bm3R1 [Pigmentiphaga humi]|uniref:HTH-type transcriptional repressor Bm3R1 n=1 Tax=Pigmentiphaga humi TaxID=2478468 RepID=A0A3P4AYN4_9BURK|nr:TetR/AcrR family transcriptional regulator [Pigmentiphaga humi]VCU69147.1 HTH-type transcriptional repressor Bm3R1 [Pigmentiphaga humi]